MNDRRVEIINLTPHEITIISEGGEEIMRIPPSGTVARVSVKSEVVGEVNGVPIRKTVYGDIVGLPEPRENTFYVVSTLVLIAAREKGICRRDLIAPDTNPDSVIRDHQGRVVGVKYFQVV